MKTSKLQNEINPIEKGLQSDLLKMLDEDSDSFEDTAATNGNQSHKSNDSPIDQNNFELIYHEKEFNFENLGKELDTQNNVK
jgi:hypothetical protein